jgi:hypothetical protein
MCQENWKRKSKINPKQTEENDTIIEVKEIESWKKMCTKKLVNWKTSINKLSKTDPTKMITQNSMVIFLVHQQSN